MTKLGLTRMLAAVLLQAASLLTHCCGGGADGPLLAQALSVDENAVPPHLQLRRPTHSAATATDDEDYEVVDGVLTLELQQEEDGEAGGSEAEGLPDDEGDGGVWRSSRRRLLMKCMSLKCLPRCPKCRLRKGKNKGLCKRGGKKLSCRRKQPKKRGGRKKLKKKSVKKKISGSVRRKTTAKRVRQKLNNNGDEGNEGNEGDEGNEGNNNEGDEGDEGNEGNEGDEGNEGNEGNEGDEGDEGNEGNEGVYGRRR